MKALPESELTESNLVALARETGFQTMRDVAIQRMLDGVTSFAEVIGVT